MLPGNVNSRLIADVGLGFGDEGKGRVICELVADLQRANRRKDAVGAVVKVNGGANSGHTAAGLKLNLLPCGVALPDVPVVALASGVVADPLKLEWETRMVEARGFSVRNRLIIDERCMLSDVTHRILDLAWEHYRSERGGRAPRGSTGRGITPAFSDEVNQWPIYFSDFRGDRAEWEEKMRGRCQRAADTVEHVCRVGPQLWGSFFDMLTTAEERANAETLEKGLLEPSAIDFSRFAGALPFSFNVDRVIEDYWSAGQLWCAQIDDLRERVLDALQSGHYVIGEFGQAWGLDKRMGFSPNVTASHTFTAEIFPSLGIPFQPVHVVGCMKAYDTKVGTHTFLTRLPPEHALGKRLSLLEFGTSTGRQRMVGWFDAVEKGSALRYGGSDEVVINKLDALTLASEDEGPLRICTAYERDDGVIFYTVPRDLSAKRYRPVYQDFSGWLTDISEVRDYADLPEGARDYVEGLLESCRMCASRGKAAILPPVKWRYIGVGPDPDQVIRS
jgi:adenylosuccinate synthase